MQRAGGIAFGLLTHALFVVTVWHLFWFLYADTAGHVPGSMGRDLLLAVQFAIPHSLLLHPRVRSRLTRWIPQAFYGCFFCAVTCSSLLVLFASWRSVGPAVWQLSGAARNVVEVGFFGSWVALFYSLYLSGLGYQTGWTPWWHWFRHQRPPERKFRPRSLYLLLRHPVYLSFLGLIWFNPIMTLDRLLLAVVWSAYIVAGSYLKDERLAYFLGDRYRKYQQQVSGYPGVPFGPLGRLPATSSAASMVRPGPNASATQGPSAA